MPHILTDVRLPREAVQRIAARPGVRLDEADPHDRDWDLTPGPDVLLCKRPPRRLDGVRWVQIATVGYEHLRDRGLADLPVTVTNARGLFDTAIAEWNVGMMVALVRDLRAMLRQQDHSVWDREPRFQQEVRGKVVGLWGYGGIGRETARLARALGMTVHVLTRHPVGPRRDAFTPAGTGDPDGVLPHATFPPERRREFLASLDFLILALPHTRESDGLVGADDLAALPRGAFLLNPARGPIVQEAALLEALRKGHLGGAALDTHFAYPLPADHPLWRFPNVILTPHISGADKSTQFPARMAELFEENLRRWLAGEPLLNVVTRREWQEA